MLGTPAVRNLIREDKIAQIYTSIQTGTDVGMCTLDQYITTTYRQDLIDSSNCSRDHRS